jgi:hypothetical protein
MCEVGSFLAMQTTLMVPYSALEHALIFLFHVND